MDTKYYIYILQMGIALLGSLESVCWVVLKYDCTIALKSNIDYSFYDLNNCSQKWKDKLWHNIGRINQQTLYEVSDYSHEQRFISDKFSHNEMLNFFKGTVILSNSI